MYPIQATVTLSNAAQLAAFNAFITGGNAIVEPESVKPTFNPDSDATQAIPREAIEAAKKETEAKKQEAAAPSQTQDTQAAASSASAPAADSAADAPKRTIDQAKDLTMKIVADKGRAAAVELLTKYGVPVAAKLAADQVADFCKDADAVLAS